VQAGQAWADEARRMRVLILSNPINPINPINPTTRPVHVSCLWQSLIAQIVQC
jgi:hypothetical protein